MDHLASQPSLFETSDKRPLAICFDKANYADENEVQALQQPETPAQRKTLVQHPRAAKKIQAQQQMSHHQPHPIRLRVFHTKSHFVTPDEETVVLERVHCKGRIEKTRLEHRQTSKTAKDQ
jgi:hypothetical protein